MGTSFFVMPAGLADGLALKKLRYGPEGPIRPRSPVETRDHWFPRSVTLGDGLGVWLNENILTPSVLRRMATETRPLTERKDG